MLNDWDMRLGDGSFATSNHGMVSNGWSHRGGRAQRWRKGRVGDADGGVGGRRDGTERGSKPEYSTTGKSDENILDGIA